MSDSLDKLYSMCRNANGHIVNYDEEKGIHYGVVNQNECSMDAINDIVDNGTDLYFEGALEEMQERIAAVLDDSTEATDEELKEILERELKDETKWFREGLIDAVLPEDWEDRKTATRDFIDSEFGQTYESDVTSYYYEQDGYKLRYNTDDGDIFVIDSPFYTMAARCSPCAPNAGYCTSKGALKTFCLGPEWFEDDKPPYDVYEVGSGKKIYEVAEVDDEQ